MLYEAQGRYDEAEPLYRRALDTYERVLGPDHPTTIAVRGNLQGFLRDQGREDEAAGLGKD